MSKKRRNLSPAERAPKGEKYVDILAKNVYHDDFTDEDVHFRIVEQAGQASVVLSPSSTFLFGEPERVHEALNPDGFLFRELPKKARTRR